MGIIPSYEKRIPDTPFITYIVTSCKGGVGKSTVSANLSMAYARLGHRVLLVDCDFSNRSLDLILGCEDDIIYDICDLAVGRSEASYTVLTDRRCADLFFIPAPLFAHDEISADEFKKAIGNAAEKFECDTVFIDTSGASDEALNLVCPTADAALIVASHNPTSIRGAEKTGVRLRSLGVDKQYLVINRYNGKEAASGKRPGVNTLIDRTHIRLIGVVPESRRLEINQDKGKLACELRHDRERVSDAFDETARRLTGERVPLMSYLAEKKRKKIINT